MKNRNKGTNKKGRNWIKEKQIQIKKVRTGTNGFLPHPNFSDCYASKQNRF